MSDEEREHERPIRVDVYHHFDGPVEVKIVNAAGEAVSVHLQPQTPTTNPTKETAMSDPFGINDNQNSDVLFVFEDEAGNVTSAPTIDPGSITVTSSDPASLEVSVNADNSGVTATADGALDAAVTVEVAFTVGGVAWTGSETFDVGASAPTQLLLSPQTPADNA